WMDGKLAFTIQRDSTTNPLVRIKLMVSTSKYFAVKPTLCKINQNFLLDFRTGERITFAILRLLVKSRCLLPVPKSQLLTGSVRSVWSVFSHSFQVVMCSMHSGVSGFACICPGSMNLRAKVSKKKNFSTFPH
ncbi:hypothetical protein BLOT_008208, partial [Blomia tropicalis]